MGISWKEQNKRDWETRYRKVRGRSNPRIGLAFKQIHTCEVNPDGTRHEYGDFKKLYKDAKDSDYCVHCGRSKAEIKSRKRYLKKEIDKQNVRTNQ